MKQSNFIRQFTALVAFCFAMALVLMFGCSSSPPEQQAPPPATQPVEEPAEQQVEPAPAVEEPNEELEELAAQVSDEDLEMFARAVRAVASREEQMEQEGRDLDTLMSQATTPADRIAAEQEVLGEMQDAVGSVGIDYDAFMSFGHVIRAHSGLMERLGEYLEAEEIEAFFGFSP